MIDMIRSHHLIKTAAATSAEPMAINHPPQANDPNNPGNVSSGSPNKSENSPENKRNGKLTEHGPNGPHTHRSVFTHVNTNPSNPENPETPVAADPLVPSAGPESSPVKTIVVESSKRVQDLEAMVLR